MHLLSQPICFLFCNSDILKITVVCDVEPLIIQHGQSYSFQFGYVGLVIACHVEIRAS